MNLGMSGDDFQNTFAAGVGSAADGDDAVGGSVERDVVRVADDVVQLYAGGKSDLPHGVEQRRLRSEHVDAGGKSAFDQRIECIWIVVHELLVHGGLLGRRLDEQ